jgi:hypothetical protein
MDDLGDMIEDLLGMDDDGTWYDDADGGTWTSITDGDGEWGYDGDGGSSSSVEWYGTESPYEATSRVLAEQHATNLEVIDNIDGVDDYEYEVVTY